MRLIEAIQNVGGFTDSYNNHDVSNNQSDSNQYFHYWSAKNIQAKKNKKRKEERIITKIFIIRFRAFLLLRKFN